MNMKCDNVKKCSLTLLQPLAHKPLLVALSLEVWHADLCPECLVLDGAVLLWEGLLDEDDGLRLWLWVVIGLRGWVVVARVDHSGLPVVGVVDLLEGGRGICIWPLNLVFTRRYIFPGLKKVV